MCTDSSVQEASSKDDDAPDSPTQDEFVSDTFNQQPLSEEDVRRELEQLGVKDDKVGGEDWGSKQAMPHFFFLFFPPFPFPRRPLPQAVL